jgi:hypothetical protein
MGTTSCCGAAKRGRVHQMKNRKRGPARSLIARNFSLNTVSRTGWNMMICDRRNKRAGSTGVSFSKTTNDMQKNGDVEMKYIKIRMRQRDDVH